MTPSLLYTKGFIPYIPTDQHRLGDWNINILPGDQVTLSGPSGSGKSLFLKSLTLLHRPHSGCVFFKNEEVKQDNILNFRRRVLYVNQHPQFSHDTIWEHFKKIFSFQVYQDAKLSWKDKVHKISNQLDLDSSLFNSRPFELSGGQKQFIQLILALTIDPEILILDEPTSSMDLSSSLKCEELLIQWVKNKRYEKSFIWVSHSKKQLQRIGNKHLMIETGRLSQSL